MPKIEIQQFVRECPHNATIVSEKLPTRNLIRDFRVLIDGEHRATLNRDYTGRSYRLSDPDGRNIKDPRKDENWRKSAEVSSQAGFLPFITMLLDHDVVPTLVDIALDRIRDEAIRDDKRFDKSIANFAHAKKNRVDDLYALALSIATADTPVLEEKLVDRARTLIAEIADQAIYWDGLEN